VPARKIARFLGCHLPRHGLADTQLAGRVDVHDSVEIVKVDVFQRRVHGHVNLQTQVSQVISNQELSPPPAMIAYTGAVDAIVDPPELLHCTVHHGLYARRISDVDFHRKGFVAGICGQFLAFFGRFHCPSLIDVGEKDSGHTSLGENEGGLSADPAGSLRADN
jgi:hypothetical protein